MFLLGCLIEKYGFFFFGYSGGIVSILVRMSKNFMVVNLVLDEVIVLELVVFREGFLGW